MLLKQDKGTATFGLACSSFLFFILSSPFYFARVCHFMAIWIADNNKKLQLIAGPLLSIIHVFSVVKEMRAAPINTLNPQRTAMIVADFQKVCFVWYEP